MYTREGSGRSVVSAYLQDQFGIDGFNGDNDAFQFVLTKPGANGEDVDIRTIALPSAVLDASPVRSYSKFPRRDGQPTTMSLPSFLLRTNKTIQSVSELQVYKIVVSCSRQQASDLKAVIESSYINLRGIQLELLADREENLTTASTIVNFFFAFCQVIAMTVCGFGLISTMATNLFQSQREIGILRSLGAPKDYVSRTFIEEAFVVTFGACALGTIVGTIVAFTLSIQRQLFTQLPIPFVFPTSNVVVLIILGVIFAFASTYTPVRQILNSGSVTSILRKAL